MTLGVLACSKTKLPYTAPARELYQGQTFKLAHAYLARRCDRIIVLSAKHHAVWDSAVLDSYDRALDALDARQRAAWALRCQRELLAMVPTGAEVLAIVPALYAPGLYCTPHVRLFAGLTQGRLKQALAQELASRGTVPA